MTLTTTDATSDLAYCRELTHRHAKSFSAGIRWFPRRVQEATYAIYGFVREPDDIVDEGGLTDDAATVALISWREDWRRTLKTGHSERAVQRAFLRVATSYEFPTDWAEAFLASMIRDTSQKTYATYAELEEYMYGSATVVGYMMARICGANDDSLPFARALGEAFQLTNFLRDVAADEKERGRIYLPEEDLARFGLCLSSVREKRTDAGWCDLMQFEIARARELYTVARSGMGYLQADCQFGVMLAADIYEGILDKIEQANYNVFAGRVRLSGWEKTAKLAHRLVQTSWMRLPLPD